MKTGFVAALALLALPATALASDEELRVVTWNVAGAERDATAVAKSVTDMIDELGKADILILQEVIDQGQVEAIATATGMTHWVISDFSPPVSITNNAYASLEVAIVSRAPIAQAAEWDITGPAANGDNFPPRPSSATTLTEELAMPIGLNTAPSRCQSARNPGSDSVSVQFSCLMQRSFSP